MFTDAFAPPVVGMDQAQACAHGRAEHRRRGGGEHIRARPLHQPVDGLGGTGDKRAGHARGLAQRGHVEHALRRDAKVRERALAVGPEHAETVRVIEQQPRLVALRHIDQRSDRRDVAVHAEHRVADDQLVDRTTRAQPRFEHADIGVRIHLHFSPRQARPVDDAGVIQRIGKHRIAGPDQCRHDAGVGHVAGRETERLRQPDEAGELGLQLLMLGVMAGNQMRGAGADAVAADRRDRGVRDRGMGSKPEIVVRSERHQWAPVDVEHRALGTGNDTPLAQERLRFEVGKPAGEVIHAVARPRCR